MSFVQEILNYVFDKNEHSIFVTDYPRTTLSKPNFFLDNRLQAPLLTPPSGKMLLIKGIVLMSDSSVGFLYLKRGNGVPADPEINTDIILPLFLSVQTRATTTGSLSLMLDVDETLDLEIVGTTTGKDSFVGVSYRIIDPQDA